MSLLWSFPRLGAAMHRHIHRHMFIPTGAALGAMGPALTPALRPIQFQPSRAMSESSKPARAKPFVRSAQEILDLIKDRESLGAGYVNVGELKQVAKHLSLPVKGTRGELLERISVVDSDLAGVLEAGKRGEVKTRIQKVSKACRFLALVTLEPRIW